MNFSWTNNSVILGQNVLLSKIWTEDKMKLIIWSSYWSTDFAPFCVMIAWQSGTVIPQSKNCGKWELCEQTSLGLHYSYGSGSIWWGNGVTRNQWGEIVLVSTGEERRPNTGKWVPNVKMSLASRISVSMHHGSKESVGTFTGSLWISCFCLYAD